MSFTKNIIGFLHVYVKLFSAELFYSLIFVGVVVSILIHKWPSTCSRREALMLDGNMPKTHLLHQPEIWFLVQKIEVSHNCETTKPQGSLTAVLGIESYSRCSIASSSIRSGFLNHYTLCLTLHKMLRSFEPRTCSTSAPSSCTLLQRPWPLVPTSAASGTTNLAWTWAKLCGHNSTAPWFQSLMSTSTSFPQSEMLLGPPLLREAPWKCKGIHSLTDNKDERGSLSIL